MSQVYTGTPEELAENDLLMAELRHLDCQRDDLDNCSNDELMEYIEDQNNVAVTAQANIRAALNTLSCRGGVAN